MNKEALHTPAVAGSIPQQKPTYGGKTVDGKHRFHLAGAQLTRHDVAQNLRKLGTSGIGYGNCKEVVLSRMCIVFNFSLV